MTTTKPTRFKMLEDFFTRRVCDVINEKVTDALLENNSDASTARVLAKYREVLKYQIASHIMEDYA